MKKRLFSIMLMLLMLLILTPTMHAEAASKVKLNKAKVIAYVGTTEKLKITGTSKKVIWKSNNNRVAKVDKKGKVTAREKGTAIITAKVSGKKYKCRVMVKNPEINKKKLTLEPKKSYVLKLQGTKIKSVKTSNKKVVTVSKKGKVTARKEGTATITLTGKNKKKYTCKITVEKHQHIWNDGEVTKEATCGEEGVKTYICKSCDKTKTESIAKLPSHEWDEGATTTKGSCVKDGIITYTCDVCGKTRTETVKAIGKHTWSEGVAYTHSTCKDEGIMLFHCMTCHEERTEKIPKKEHTWYNYIVITEPTCTKEGEALYTCVYCGCQKTEPIAKLTHYVGQMDSYLVVGKDSTCAEEGYYNRICKRCNQIMWTENMPKKDGHYPSDWIIDEAYCTKEGKKHVECTICKEILDEAIVKETGHDCEWNVTKEPSVSPATCEEDFGIRVGNCKNCDIILEENIIRIDIGNNQTHLVYGYYDDAMAMECLEFINDQRVNHTRSKELIGDEWIEKEVLPLETNDSEMLGAKIRAAELTYLYSHTRPNSQRKWNEYFHGGENIVHGVFSAFSAFDVWMRSEGHAANIIRSEFGYTGIAVFWESRIDPDTGCVFYYPNWVNGFTYADYYETQHN